MIKIKCNYCERVVNKYPCEIKERNYCLQTCFHKSRIGSSPWNKGIPFSTEAKRKMKEAKLGKDVSYLHNPENERKAREVLISSGVLKRKWEDPAYRQKMLEHLVRLNTSPEHKISSRKGAQRTHELHPELTRLAREGLNNPEARRKLSKAAKEQWQRMKVEMIKAQRQGMKRPNKVELTLSAILDKNFSGQWKYTGNGEIVIGNLIPDFTNTNGRKEVIELFGDYWHSSKCKQPYRTEEERRKIYNEYGYRMLVIWEHEVKNLPETEIIAKVREFQC